MVSVFQTVVYLICIYHGENVSGKLNNCAKQCLYFAYHCDMRGESRLNGWYYTFVSILT